MVEFSWWILAGRIPCILRGYRVERSVIRHVDVDITTTDERHRSDSCIPVLSGPAYTGGVLFSIRLRDAAMADVVILGCAGMTAFRTDLEDYLGVPVVEPCQAAVAMAIGRVALQKTRLEKA